MLSQLLSKVTQENASSAASNMRLLLFFLHSLSQRWPAPCVNMALFQNELTLLRVKWPEVICWHFSGHLIHPLIDWLFPKCLIWSLTNCSRLTCHLLFTPTTPRKVTAQRLKLSDLWWPSEGCTNRMRREVPVVLAPWPVFFLINPCGLQEVNSSPRSETVIARDNYQCLKSLERPMKIHLASFRALYFAMTGKPDRCSRWWTHLHLSTLQSTAWSWHLIPRKDTLGSHSQHQPLVTGLYPCFILC